jgi:hypothetical protein
MLACGAALLNLRLAVKVLGVAADVQLFPDTSDHSLLAVVRPDGFTRASAADDRLARAIWQRHTNRRPFLDEQVPDALLGEMRSAARLEHAWMALVAPAQRAELRRLLSQAHHRQQQDPRFLAEFAEWTNRDGRVGDGVPAGSAGRAPQQTDLWVMRDFTAGDPRPGAAGRTFESDPAVAVIGTFHDLPLDQLQAGQAMQRVLLTATAHGLATSFLSQVIEVPDTRTRLRQLLGGATWPQTVLRIGYGTAAPATPRRGIDQVVTVHAIPAPEPH